MRFYVIGERYPERQGDCAAQVPVLQSGMVGLGVVHMSSLTNPVYYPSQRTCSCGNQKEPRWEWERQYQRWICTRCKRGSRP